MILKRIQNSLLEKEGNIMKEELKQIYSTLILNILGKNVIWLILFTIDELIKNLFNSPKSNQKQYYRIFSLTYFMNQ